MRIEGAANSQNIEPVQNPVQVKSNVTEVKPIEKSSDTLADEILASEMNSHNINLKSGDIKMSEKALIEAIERANKAIIGTKREFEYVKHEVINAFTVKVINSETKEVIREIPPEKILDLVANLMELAGVLVDEKR